MITGTAIAVAARSSDDQGHVWPAEGHPREIQYAQAVGTFVLRLNVDRPSRASASYLAFKRTDLGSKGDASRPVYLEGMYIKMGRVLGPLMAYATDLMISDFCALQWQIGC